jgi:YHS domain-containing protein
MISIRKFWWATLAAAAIAGCSGEEANPGGGTNAPPVTPGPAPTVTGGGMSAEMKPAEPAKPEASAAEKTETPAAVPAPPAEAPKDAAGEKKADAAALSSEEVAEIKKLPEAEAAVALKQMVCPVSGENLGSMGMPYKVSAEGKTFYLCCKSCNKDVVADPKGVVAKLKP